MKNIIQDGKTLETAYEKSVEWSIKSINTLHEERAYKVMLPGFPLDKVIATSTKEKGGEVCCKFFLEQIQHFQFNQYWEKFGIDEDITFDSNGDNYIIKKDSISRLSATLGEPQVITIYSKRMQKGLDKDYDGKMLRLITPITEKVEIGINIFEFKSIRIGESTRPAGLAEITVKNKKYHLYAYENKDTGSYYLFIDALEDNSFNEFKTNTNAIILGLAFITGNLYQNEYYYQVVKHDKITLVENTSFELAGKSIISNTALFDPSNFIAYLKGIGREDEFKNISLRLKNETFTKLSELLINNETIARCILLILEGNQSSFILLRAAIYSVALETLTNVVYEENKDKINPISDKKLAATISKKMKAVVNEYDEHLTDYSKGILDAKINDFNKPTNSKKLSIPFELLGIKLKKEDLDILNYRNKFLHGTSPFSEIELTDKKTEVVYISKRFHFMINCLLLKYIGYQGHIKDYSALDELNRKQRMTNHLYQII